MDLWQPRLIARIGQVAAAAALPGLIASGYYIASYVLLPGVPLRNEFAIGAAMGAGIAVPFAVLSAAAALMVRKELSRRIARLMWCPLVVAVIVFAITALLPALGSHGAA